VEVNPVLLVHLSLSGVVNGGDESEECVIPLSGGPWWVGVHCLFPG